MEAPSRTATMPVLAGAALLVAGAGISNFVAPQGPTPSLRSKDRVHADGASREVPSCFGASKAAAVAACGLVASAGLVAIQRRKRSALSAWTAYRDPKQEPVFVKGRDSRTPQLVFDWTVDPVYPVPGSEAMFKTMVGGDVELNGGEPWDPFGWHKLYDRNFDFNNVMVYPHVQWLREAEIKHGRICMLAFVGMAVQQFYQIPGYPAEPDWTKALAACYDNQLTSVGIAQISMFIFLVEGRFSSHEAWYGQMDREPGDLGFDPLKLTKKPGFDLKAKQLSELKNGRLAMIGVASLVANHAIPGSVPLLTGAYAVPPEIQVSGQPSAFCGSTLSKPEASSRTAAKYTTQVILPSLTWLKTGIKASDLAPTQLIAQVLGGNDILVGKDESGTVFCVANLCPHIGTPMSEGADVIGDAIVCPLHGSSWNVKTGDLIDWCPSPPIIGPLTGLVVNKKNLLIFEARTSFFGGDIEVLVDTNAKKAYEADYWKGILDAQGKNDGTYY